MTTTKAGIRADVLQRARYICEGEVRTIPDHNDADIFARELLRLHTALEAQPKAPASAVECEEALSTDALIWDEKTGYIKAWDSKKAVTIITAFANAHTASAVAAAREKALDEVAKWADDNGLDWDADDGSCPLGDVIRALKGKAAEVGA